uniref:Pif-3 n=1 Tax=Cydia pomonella granulosis virus TaxID=28289 RepID=A0A097P1T0_GVCP|nr:ORF35 pif-3 [Cydia pomonella granulovirus]AIU36823.1 ORF35 pif-3 [Cydia pomonella granulovirus]AIU36960.1 ORF35 pif-3 [Cydia pomonella granulovirus]AIU37102.1 ORF35 pif-3 [Cydia pomonella granulovirus]QDW81095.1 pif-3 [Cydia pomonella granulovirus]
MWWAVFLILMVIVGMVVLVNGWLRTDLANMNRRVNIAFERHNILDCDAVNVPCVTDAQCRDNCRGGLVMHCNAGGFCARGARVDSSVEDCDASRGLVVVLNAVEGIVVERMCVSLYRDVVEDDGKLRPYVCGSGGSMWLDLETDMFSVEDCVCAAGYTRFSYSSGAFTRTIPVCIPNASAALYQRVYGRSH